MKKNTKIALVMTLAIVVGAGTWYLNNARSPSAPAAKPSGPVPVTVAKAQIGEMPVLLNVVGRAEAYESVTLKSRLDGQVLAVSYIEGQAVKQGDVLLRLDPADFNAKLAQAEAVVARDLAQLSKARADVERYKGLKEKGFVSEEKVNELRTNEAAAQATMKANQAALELARLQLSYTTIKAPFSGVVGARLVFPGSAVKTNDTTLAVINRIKPLYVTFSVPERQIQSLKRSMSAGALTVQVSEPGNREAIFTGKAKFIDNAVDSSTGTIQIKAVLENQDARLTPGQFLNISMVLDKLTDAVLVPNEAVQQGADGNFLYVVKADNSVEARKIMVASAHQGVSAIAKGLAADETVVTDGQLRLTPGAQVKTKSGKAEEAKANPSPAPAR